MNNNRRLYYPAVLYAASLLLLWLLSWVMGVAGLLMGNEALSRSLVSAEGVRWVVRSASASLDAAPWATIMLIVLSVGLLSGSGMVKSAAGMLRRGAMSINEKRAWLFALPAAVTCLLLLFAVTVSPWNMLLGVTGNFYTSPLLQGWVFVAFLLVLFVTSVYGYIYGNYRSLPDIARSMGAACSFYAPALLAVVPATGIVPCIEYMELLPQGDNLAVFADVLYLLPFVYVTLLRIARV